MIKLENVDLIYELYKDKTNNLKEKLANYFRKSSSEDRQTQYHKALDGVSFTVNPGERVGIIGSNGAGKSTLLKVISGILKPNHGTIHVDGAVQPLIELGAGFDLEISGIENIYLNGYMLGFTKDQVQEKEEEIIKFADIGEYIDVPVKYYSSGMMVRLAFSIATSIEPENLIIDEMLGVGDFHFLQKAEKRLHGVIEKAKSVVVVSHDHEFLKRMCENTYLLNSGKVIDFGKTDFIVEKFRSMDAK